MILLQVIQKFRRILSKHQKFRIFEMAVLMIFGGILETCSVSLILPFMEAAVNPDEMMLRPYMILISDWIHINSPQKLLVLIAIILALLYILKNAYLLFEYHIQYRFVYGNMFEMQKRLLDNFIHRPYEYFLGVNSGEIIRIVNVDTPTAFNSLLTVLNLVTESVVFCMLIITVFYIAPAVTLMITGLLLIMMICINRFIKPVLKNAGIENQRAGAGMNKWLLQSIQGIKELKVMNRESFFQANYDFYGRQYVRALQRKELLNIMPRFLLEAVSMASMFIVLAFLIYQGEDLQNIVPVISAVAMAAVRLLPSVNRISGAMASLAYGEPMLDKLIENLSDMCEKEETFQKMNSKRKDFAECSQFERFSEKITLKEISYHYPDVKKNVLDQVYAEILKGESVGIAGSSGSGKTTAADIILGLLQPQNGQVLADGTDIRCIRRKWLEQTGYIPQMIFMLDDSIRANISFGTPDDKVSDREIWRALEEASLADFVRELPEGLDTQIGERGVRLSGGQRQRIGIARALYRNPEVIIFDEATSALDNDTELAIMDSIHKLHGKKTLIIIAHRLTTIEMCDRIYRVENGRIIGK